MQIITTKDGSHTLYSEKFNEVYHSRHGAIEESRHVFLQNGLNYALNNLSADDNGRCRIFEMGFGTGLNALLTMLEAERRNLKIDYETIELYPVAIETIKELNYTQELGYEFCYGPYHTLHLCRWGEWHDVTPHFKFMKREGALLDMALPENDFHLIYFDAFAPTHQPEMWSEEVFRKMYSILKPGGIMVTYCSKSIVRKAMEQAGFVIKKLQGPQGKREMIQAHKPVA